MKNQNLAAENTSNSELAKSVAIKKKNGHCMVLEKIKIDVRYYAYFIEVHIAWGQMCFRNLAKLQCH